ncbi:universal stress protein [Gulosibacter sp. 10]|uniref:universal stress protein n=1 Tax=Gulosibacter sp. 10 TaxID=1255570 RepID=UPI00097F62E7|nr:universal stress protein [Gulosibacter sp. 10]SJM70957.1 Universal stress protein family [Gulosibacter sp. 10]
MTTRIAVGINGSPADARAVEWAARRAARDGAALTVFAAMNPLPEGGTAVEVKNLEHWVDGLLSEHAAAARALEPDVEVHTEVERSTSLPAAFEKVSSRVDLLVIGGDTDEERGEKRPGTVRIAAVSECPVVAVPDVDVSGRSGVVVGVDGSEVSANALEFAAAEAAAVGEPLIAVMAWQSDISYGYGYASVERFQLTLDGHSRQELETALESTASNHPGLEIRRVVAEGRPAAVLSAAAENARLLVVGTHGRGAFRRLLLGSVSHDLLWNVALPTAVVR